MTHPAIRIRELCKSFEVKDKASGLRGSIRSLVRPTYRTKTALHPLDLDVEQGEVLAFMGPNGAGKSTTIKMLTGILHPTSGHAEVLGICPWRERRKLAFAVGSVFGQKSQLWYHLPAIDSFELMGQIYEMERSSYRSRVRELIDRFDIGSYVHTPVRKLSLGERMRCEIAAALLHQPRMIFLDEPTIGLDVIVKQQIRELIMEMNREEGTTLFLTSHDAGDVEKLCRRAIVINHGRMILDQKVSRLKRDFLRYKTIRLLLKEGSTPPPIFPGLELEKHNGLAYKMIVDTSRMSIEEVLGCIVSSCRLADVTIEDPPMEEVIARIYEGAGEAVGE